MTTTYDKKACDTLISTLQNERSNYLSRIDAMKALVLIATAVVDPTGTVKTLIIKAVVEAMLGKDRMVGREAVKTLAKIGGPEAIQALIQELNREGSALTQNVAEALGTMGAVDALSSLAHLADQGSVFTRSAAKNAIQKIKAKYPNLEADTAVNKTNQPSSISELATEQVVASQTAIMEKSENLTFNELAAILTQRIGCQIVAETNDKIEAKFEIEGGRFQTVYLIHRPFREGKKNSGYLPGSMLSLYSVCAELSEVNMEWALRYNMRLPYGALAVNEHVLRTGEKKSLLVMVATIPLDQLSTSFLIHMVKTVAYNSDRLEANLHEADDY